MQATHATPHTPHVIPVAAPGWSLRRAARGGFLFGVALTLLAVFFTRWVLLFALATLLLSASLAAARAIVRVGGRRAERRRWRRQQALAQRHAWAAQGAWRSGEGHHHSRAPYGEAHGGVWAHGDTWSPAHATPANAWGPAHAAPADAWSHPERDRWADAPPPREVDVAQRALDDFDRRLAEAMQQDAAEAVAVPARERSGT